MTNPYAPPAAVVQDIADPYAETVAADRGTRLGAAILDSIIFGAMVYVPLVISMMFAGAAASATDDSNSGMMMLAFGMGALPLVGLIVWVTLTIKYLRNGQSIAKKFLGLKVVRSDGSPASLGRLIWLRNVVTWVMSIIPLYGLVDSLFIFGESRQCLHDKIADTIVVKA